MPETLYDKLWNSHVVRDLGEDNALLYIDRHLVHEVTSPQAFEGLRTAQRKPWREESIVATPDHNTPTTGWERDIEDLDSRAQVHALDRNLQGLKPLAYFPFRHERQGVLHVVAPELGATLPGTVVVCGDSHTSTHGAFAALAFGIGTSDVEHVLATQTLQVKRASNMQVRIDGMLAPGVTAKDVILAVIGRIGAAGGTGCAIEFTGSTVTQMSMEQRMTVCNMAIEAGARTGLVAFDAVTRDYLKGRTYAPKGSSWHRAVAYWESLHSDPGARFDRVVTIDAASIEPQVTWGTSPEMVVAIHGKAPDPAWEADPQRRQALERALAYMGLVPGQPLIGLPIDQVFIGSCTNSRIEDLRAAATVVRGNIVSPAIKRAIVVPGSGSVKRQAELEGLDQVFLNAGFEWRQPGCSMCLAMNDDRLLPQERCASTSNRNFEGRQGAGGRSHLMSPAMAAAAAIAGELVDIRSWNS
jgi:3-isopropylmalate/(R)-2-methylmalate dehydratase large subunit